MLSKKNSSKKQQKEFKRFDYVKVNRVHDFGNGRIGFNADFGFDGVPAITIYNLTWVEGTRKDGTEYGFVSMPQEKGSDGNYYNRVYFPLDDGMTSAIQGMLEDALESTTD